MNENYIIDGNAVYEIDTDCAETNMPYVGQQKVETQMIFEKGQIDIRKAGDKDKHIDETVSVFF